MKKLFFILLILIFGVAMGQSWQPVNPSGIMYNETVTGTKIIITPTLINVTTTSQYTGIQMPLKLEITIYDSVGRFDDKLIIVLPCRNTMICKSLYDYATKIPGEFVFTIFGTPKQPSTQIIGYSINIFTYKSQKKYEEYIKSILK